MSSNKRSSKAERQAAGQRKSRALVRARKATCYVQAAQGRTHRVFTLAANARQAADIVAEVLSLPGWSLDSVERQVRARYARTASGKLVLSVVARLRQAGA